MNGGEKKLQEGGPGLQVQLPLEELDWQVLVLVLVLERGGEPQELLLQEGGNTDLCTSVKRLVVQKGMDCSINRVSVL